MRGRPTREKVLEGAYIAGETYGLDFPTTPEAIDTNFTGMSEIFVTKIAPPGSSLVYSTFLEGTDVPSRGKGGEAIAVDGEGERNDSLFRVLPCRV